MTPLPDATSTEQCAARPPRRHAAEQESLDTAEPTRPHEETIRAPLLCLVEEGLLRITGGNHRGDRQPRVCSGAAMASSVLAIQACSSASLISVPVCPGSRINAKAVHPGIECCDQSHGTADRPLACGYCTYCGGGIGRAIHPDEQAHRGRVRLAVAPSHRTEHRASVRIFCDTLPSRNAQSGAAVDPTTRRSGCQVSAFLTTAQAGESAHASACTRQEKRQEMRPCVLRQGACVVHRVARLGPRPLDRHGHLGRQRPAGLDDGGETHPPRT